MEFVSAEKGRASLQLAERGATDELRAVLLADASELEAKDWAGDGLLAIACWHGREETAKMLLTEFKVDANARNSNGATPLHRASQSGDLNCAQSLLEKSADASLCDRSGKKPIDVAASAEMKELIQGLLDITEEYIRELQKKIELADQEHDQTVLLQLEADRRVRVAARIQDAVSLLIQGAKCAEANGFYDPLGDSYDDWPVYRRRADNVSPETTGTEGVASPPSSPHTANASSSSCKGSAVGSAEDLYLFFAADESAWVVQHVHPDKGSENSMFQTMSALQSGHLPFERQGRRYLKLQCSTECFPELRPEGSNFIEEYEYTRRKSVLSLKTEVACVPTSAVEVLTESMHKAHLEVEALKKM